jgi:hypothetical protein
MERTSDIVTNEPEQIAHTCPCPHPHVRTPPHARTHTHTHALSLSLMRRREEEKQEEEEEKKMTFEKTIHILFCNSYVRPTESNTTMLMNNVSIKLFLLHLSVFQMKYVKIKVLTYQIR